MKPAALALVLGTVCLSPLANASPQQAAFLRQRAQALTDALRNQWAERKAAGLTPAVVTEPSLVAGAILTPSIDVGVAPGVPALQITVKAGTVGLNAFIATIASPDGLHSVSTSFLTPPAYPAEPAKQTIKFVIASPFSNSGFGLYTVPGRWMLSSVTLFTKDGQIVEYGPGQLPALFPSTTVNVTNNGTPDSAPPTARKGVVLTPTVSLSAAAPVFAARVYVKDDVSGVGSVNIGIAGPAGTNFSTGAYDQPLDPVTEGSAIPSATLPANSPVGTYTITSFGVCDVAQNCTFVDSQAEIEALFGTTTFTVTN